MFINPNDGDEVYHSLAQSSRMWLFESRPYVLVNKTGVNIVSILWILQNGLNLNSMSLAKLSNGKLLQKFQVTLWW